MLARPRLAALTLGLVALVGPLGCGSGGGPEHATVHGRVTYAGKPVPFGFVLFLPVQPPSDGQLQPARGDLQADGTYTLKSENDAGAILGDHKVVVIAVEGDKPVTTNPGETPAAPTPSKSTGKVQFKSAVPRKFTDLESTPLVRSVKAGDNTIDIDLTD